MLIETHTQSSHVASSLHQFILCWLVPLQARGADWTIRCTLAQSKLLSLPSTGWWSLGVSLLDDLILRTLVANDVVCDCIYIW
jgi:hypothetical protein